MSGTVRKTGVWDVSVSGATFKFVSVFFYGLGRAMLPPKVPVGLCNPNDFVAGGYQNPYHKQKKKKHASTKPN